MTEVRPDAKKIRFPVFQGLLRFLFATKTYTGTMRGKVLWIDGATIRDADIEECVLVYIGLGGLTFEGDVKIHNFTMYLAGPADISNQILRFFEVKGQRQDEH